MRPIPIDEADAHKISQRNGGVLYNKVVMAAPNGDLLDDDIRPVEAVVYEGDDAKMFAMVIALEDNDLLKLQSNGGKILVTMVSGVVPYDVEVL